MSLQILQPFGSPTWQLTVLHNSNTNQHNLQSAFVTNTSNRRFLLKHTRKWVCLNFWILSETKRFQRKYVWRK